MKIFLWWMKRNKNINMLNLKEYIKESILDDEEVVFNDAGVKSEIEKFIKDNYKCVQFTISNKPNRDGKFVVDGKTIQVVNKNITSLTNNLFIWGKVNGYFDCHDCKSLISLKGAPEKVRGNFDCIGNKFSVEDIKKVVRSKYITI